MHWVTNKLATIVKLAPKNMFGLITKLGLSKKKAAHTSLISNVITSNKLKAYDTWFFEIVACASLIPFATLPLGKPTA